MSERRSFNTSERNELYRMHDGKCAICNEALDPGWHADHKVPFSKGGRTEVGNGQPLCSTCNLKKGSSLPPFVPRRWQADAAKEIASEAGNTRKKRVFLWSIAPGGGKTYGALSVAESLFRRGAIDQVIIAVPRTNLQIQFVEDWNGKRDDGVLVEPGLMHIINGGNPPAMSKINALIQNSPPFVLAGNSGYVLTYSALISRTAREDHLRQARSKRTLLICDEVQQLGLDNQGGGTKSADFIKHELAQACEYIILMTGTPYRNDGRPLLGGSVLGQNLYKVDPENPEMQVLNPDISYTYLQGVRDRVLRRYEDHLFRVTGERRTLKNALETHEKIDSEELNEGLYELISHKDVWQPMLEYYVGMLEGKRAIHPGFCGLVATHRTEHAARIYEYLKQSHPNLKVLIATSEEADAFKNLMEFRRGDYDILVTVEMAFMGYSHKPIIGLLNLTCKQSTTFQDQLTARALRVWSAVPYSAQKMFMIAPKTPFFNDYSKKKREHSDEGQRLYEERQEERERRERGESNEIPLSYIHSATVGENPAVNGMLEKADIAPEEYEYFAKIQKQMAADGNDDMTITDIAAVIRYTSHTSTLASLPAPAQDLSDLDERFEGAGTEVYDLKAKKAELNSIVTRLDRLHDWDFGTTSAILKKKTGKGLPDCTSPEEVDERIAIVQALFQKGTINLADYFGEDAA